MVDRLRDLLAAVLALGIVSAYVLASLVRKLWLTDDDEWRYWR